jgi:hypothetical protein
MFRTPWASIARIEVDGKHSGTGFLVSSRHVLTALHVVADKNTGQPYRGIRLFFDTNAEFEDGSKIFETDASVAAQLWNSPHDFALLECDVPDRARPLRMSDNCVPFDRCSSPGFGLQKPTGFTVTGQVSSLNEPMDGGGAAIGVQFEFGSGVRMHGHSGAPLLVRGRVVGLLRTAFTDASEDLSAGGIVHSTAVQHVVDFCNRFVPGLLSCRATIRWASPAATQSPLLLADRRPEFELFQRMISGQSRERFVFLEGESGIGKSTLLDELANYARPLGVPVGRADCKGAPPLADLFDSLLLSFPNALFPATRAASGTQPYSLILEEIADLERPVVIQIDTWDQSNDAVRKWTVKTVSELAANPGLIVMVAGPRMELLDKACPPDLCALRPLRPIMSTADWHDYAVRRWPNTGLTHAHIQGSVITFGGVPLNVEANLALLQRSLPVASPPGGAP